MGRVELFELLRAPAAVAVLVLGVGCAVTPKSFKADPQPVQISWPGPVSIGVGGHVEALSVLLAEGNRYPLELDDMSDKLARLLLDSLEEAGTSIGPGARASNFGSSTSTISSRGPA